MNNHSAVKKFHLSPWMEVIGKMQKVWLDSNTVCVRINDKTFEFEADCNETLSNIQKMLGNHVGKEVALLKTNMSKNPILIQSIFRFESDPS